ncbi:hypothetical protein [Bradyrhizobium sp. CCBAU 21362]|uniref:hypothetical protein n=1 Tax=Bradyrhizobium sp. CCBAU 21362 TaxID=1325082 RepID=UPI0023059F98|nr:hypothetical protein [Bradyrhizobium sp. CCBAU 21362]
MSISHSDYFRRLVDRHQDGVRVLYFEFGPGEAAKCYENVDRFTALYPDHKPAHGWLLTQLANADGSSTGIYRIICHSVVRRPNGELIDVPPMDERDRGSYVFLEHADLDVAFESLKIRFAELYYPPITDLFGQSPHA